MTMADMTSTRPHNGMPLTNLVIEVKGNRARAHVIWTVVTFKQRDNPLAPL